MGGRVGEGGKVSEAVSEGVYSAGGIESSAGAASRKLQPDKTIRNNPNDNIQYRTGIMPP
jgi:hypothetical protein